MLMPRIFEDNFVDNFFDDVFRPANRPATIMKTDIKEQEDAYELDIELPGYKKENLSIELNEGNLIIKASEQTSSDATDEKNNYVRKERYCGTCQRTFYVGKKVEQEDIKATFEDGILKLTVPKQSKKAEPEKKYISIA